MSSCFPLASQSARRILGQRETLAKVRNSQGQRWHTRTIHSPAWKLRRGSTYSVKPPSLFLAVDQVVSRKQLWRLTAPHTRAKIWTISPRSLRPIHHIAIGKAVGTKAALYEKVAHANQDADRWITNVGRTIEVQAP